MDEPAREQLKVTRGRGAVSNASGRFDAHAREAFDDGWGTDDDLPAPKTQVQADASRSLLVYNESPDIPFDRSINPYRGCEHGCIYCFARPTHAYLGLSPGLDFETRNCSKKRCENPATAASRSRSASTPTRTSRSNAG